MESNPAPSYVAYTPEGQSSNWVFTNKVDLEELINSVVCSETVKLPGIASTSTDGGMHNAG